MTDILKYNLKQITDLSFSGFEFEIPEDTLLTINYLCSQVGSSGIHSSLYKKTESERMNDNGMLSSANALSGFKSNSKKKRGNKSMEVSSEEWESIRTFQATKIEQKSGIDGEIDQIRLLLNKLTDKTFLDIREKLIEQINKICLENSTEELFSKIGNMIYDLSSNNKFYSKVFADLFAELLTTYKWLRPVFDEKYKNIMEQYKNIQYVDPDKDYDGFCDMNKLNEKRKAITTFFVNLANNGFILKTSIIEILKKLLEVVYDLIHQNDKKNEVDELTENIAILFNKEMIDEVMNGMTHKEELFVCDKPIIDAINHLAKSKAKDYPSLSNKAIFKYMDLIEM